MKRLIMAVMLLVSVTFGFSKEIGIVEDVPVFLLSEKVTIPGSITVDVVEDSESDTLCVHVKLYANDTLVWSTMYRQNYLHHEIDDMMYSIMKYNKSKKDILDYCEKVNDTPDNFMILLASDSLGMAFTAMSTRPDYALYSKKYDKKNGYVSRFCIMRKYANGLDKNKFWALTDNNVNELQALFEKAISYIADGEKY